MGVAKKSTKFSKWNKSVPEYSELQKMVVECIDRGSVDSFSVLDLGVGRGGTADEILSKFPNALYDGVDSSSDVLVLAKKNLKKFTNIQLVASDFLEFIPKKKYDFVVAVLSLHHSTNDEKATLLKRAKSWLKDGGSLIIGDLVKLNDEFLQSKAVAVFEKYRDNVLTEKEKLELKEHLLKDKHIINTFNETRSFLLEAGFSKVDILWWYYRLAVLVAK